MSTEKYTALVKYCLDNEIKFGFDSCSAPRFEKALESCDISKERKRFLSMCSERCESGLFSAYIDCSGKYWHCSFGENNERGCGMDVTKVNDFLKDVWLTEEVEHWRWELNQMNRECPLYPEINSNR